MVDRTTVKSEVGRGLRWRWLILAALVALVFLTRPLLVTYHVWQASGALECRDSRRAFSHLEWALELDPEHGESHLYLARLYRRQGRLDQMRSELKLAWELGAPVDRLEREQQLALAQSGRLHELESVGLLLASSGDDGAEACDAIVKGLLHTYQLGEAQLIIDGWLADYPDDPQPYFHLGTLQASKLRWNDAVQEFQRALKRRPERADIRVHLAEALRELHRYDEAVSHFQLCLKQDPEIDSAHVGLGKCFQVAAREDEARLSFETALKWAPDNFDAILALGMLEMNSGNLPVAIKTLRRATTLRSFSAPAHYGLATALRQSGDIGEATRHFKRAEEIGDGRATISKLMDLLSSAPDPVELRYEIGMSILKFGDPAEGAAWLHSVLEFHPEHAQAHSALAAHYSDVGEDEQADIHRRRAESDRR